jgi:hypothetical protein
MQSARSSLLCGVLLLGSCLAADAATLTGAEYFIDPTPWLVPHPPGSAPCDNDPGTGGGTPLPPLDGTWNSAVETVQLAGVNPASLSLTPGIHDLCVRFKDGAGRWGATQWTHFTTGRRLAVCEYYIDSDPGPGAGRPLPAADGAFNSNQEALRIGAIPTTGLSMGGHTIGARCRDDWGRWGAVTTGSLNIVSATTTDFIVTGITMSPTLPVGNSTFTATVTVKNQGTGAGDGGTLVVWANQGATQACGATGNKSLPVGSLSAGATKTLTFTGLPAGSGGSAVKTLRAFADGACVTAETNETNNQLTKAYRVTGVPNFVVGAVTLSPALPKANGTMNVTVTLSNRGTATADAGFLDIWANQSAVQNCGATGDAWAAIGSLAAGASRTVTLTVPTGAAGAKTLRVFADSSCETRESSETDNQLTRSYTVN